MTQPTQRLSDEQVAEKNICTACCKDCTFLAFAEGLCIPCSDVFQSLEKVDLVRRLAQAGVVCRSQVTELQAAQREIAELQQAYWNVCGDASSSCGNLEADNDRLRAGLRELREYYFEDEEPRQRIDALLGIVGEADGI